MTNVNGIAGERLLSFVQRIERLEEEREALSADKREVYAEAKATGLDVKIMRECVRLRRQDKGERDEHDLILAAYMLALEKAENPRAYMREENRGLQSENLTPRESEEPDDGAASAGRSAAGATADRGASGGDGQGPQEGAEAGRPAVPDAFHETPADGDSTGRDGASSIAELPSRSSAGPAEPDTSDSGNGSDAVTDTQTSADLPQSPPEAAGVPDTSALPGEAVSLPSAPTPVDEAASPLDIELPAALDRRDETTQRRWETMTESSSPPSMTKAAGN